MYIWENKIGDVTFITLNNQAGMEVVLSTNGASIYDLKVIDKNNNSFMVKTDDPRIASGELVVWSKNKITVKDKFNKYYYVSIDDPRYLSGELVFMWKGKKHTDETIEKLNIQGGKYYHISQDVHIE